LGLYVLPIGINVGIRDFAENWRTKLSEYFQKQTVRFWARLTDSRAGQVALASDGLGYAPIPFAMVAQL
jgi:hypothetical protein